MEGHSGEAGTQFAHELTHSGPVVVKACMGHEARFAADALAHPALPYPAHSVSPRNRC